MKKLSVFFLVICCIIVNLKAGAYAAEQTTYYWAQGEKIYIDSIPGEYLALYEPAQAGDPRIPQSMAGKNLRLIETPPEIKLPPDAALVRMEESGEYSDKQVQREGQRIRALVPAFRDHETSAMVLIMDMVIVKFRPNVSKEESLYTMAEAGLVDPVESEYVPNQFIARHPLGGTHTLEAVNALY